MEGHSAGSSGGSESEETALMFSSRDRDQNRYEKEGQNETITDDEESGFNREAKKRINRKEESLIFSRRAAQRTSPTEKRKMGAKESLNFRLCDNFIFRERMKTGAKQRHLQKTLGKWLMCVLIGIAIGFVAVGIREAVDFLTEIRLKTTWEYMDTGRVLVPMLIFVSFNIAFALMACIPAVFIQPLSGGSGIPEVKAFLNGIEMPKTFNVVTLLGKIFSLIFSFSSGLALGPEGPMVHIATMIAAGLSLGRSKTLNFDLRLFLTFRNHGDKRDFVTIGTAAGMAAAFGAPVGGVLFALEETASYWTRTLALRTFFCCMIATFTVNILLNLGGGVAQDYGLLTLSISGVYTYHWAELVSFSLIGVTAGLLGPLFVFLNIRLTKYRIDYLHLEKSRKIMEIVVVAIITAMLSFWLPFLFGCSTIPSGSVSELSSGFVPYPNCYDTPNQYNQMSSLIFNNPEITIRLLFANMTSSTPTGGTTIHQLPFSFPSLALFIIVYFSLMTVTAGLGLAGGLFIPNMIFGATVGRFIGQTVEVCFPDSGIDSSIYAMIGSAAFVAGSLRLSLSICVIIVELTGMTSYLLPLILVTMIAKWIGDFFTESIYEHLIELKHLPFLQTHPPSSMLPMSLGDVMATDVVCLRLSDRVDNIVRALKLTTHNGFPVVDDENHLYGLISREQLLHLLKLRQFSENPNALPFITYDEFSHLLGMDPPPLDSTPIAPHEEKMWVDLHPYMNSSVATAGKEDSFVEGYRTFRMLGVRHMVIVSKRNTVLGLITRKDLI